MWMDANEVDFPEIEQPASRRSSDTPKCLHNDKMRFREPVRRLKFRQLLSAQERVDTDTGDAGSLFLAALRE